MTLPREDDGTLPHYAWPGGYQIVYLDHHNDTLCSKCANELENDPDTLLDGLPLNHFIYWEGPDIYCDECQEPIESEYGDPWEEEEDNDLN